MYENELKWNLPLQFTYKHTKNLNEEEKSLRFHLKKNIHIKIPRLSNVSGMTRIAEYKFLSECGKCNLSIKIQSQIAIMSSSTYKKANV